uniref:Uncharacterized protein n=1 Tax=Ursus americanus TaxID=9643 RepID=A0A452R1J1_URSAM
ISLQYLENKNLSHSFSKDNRKLGLLFSPLELTRGSSVLCLSQKENVSPQNIAEAVKVAFQLRNRTCQSQNPEGSERKRPTCCRPELHGKVFL